MIDDRHIPPASSFLTDAQREQQPLLERYGIIVLPTAIDEDAYREMTWALFLGRQAHPGRALELRCAGHGGGVYPGLAIADLVIADGHVDGVLVGNASSTSSAIWAACAHRFVYPLASICVHDVQDKAEEWATASYIRAALTSNEFLDRRLATIYANASEPGVDWWRAKMTSGHGNAVLIEAAELIAIGAARPIEESALPGKPGGVDGADRG